MKKINLFISYYQCGDPERQEELDFCYNTNKMSGLFNEIINFTDRPKYNDFFEATKSYPNDINILANADIYFNESIERVKTMLSMEAFALTRWEINEDGNIVSFDDMHQYNRGAQARHSQDVWVFNGVVNGIYGDFHIGRPGCDNRIAFEIMRAGYILSNPSHDIKCIHKHKNTERNYTMGELVPKPYKWVEVGGHAPKPKRSRI